MYEFMLVVIGIASLLLEATSLLLAVLDFQLHYRSDHSSTEANHQ